MAYDYNQRLDDLLRDNPYARKFGVEPPPPEVAPSGSVYDDISEPLPEPRPDPTRPSEAGPRNFYDDISEPIGGDIGEEIPPAGTQAYNGPTDQNYFQQGVNTYTRATAAGAADLTGQTMQGAAADPLGWLAGVEKLMPYRWGVNALGYRTPTQMLADAARPEKPIGFLDRAGKAVSDFANKNPDLASPPEWQGGLTESFGRATGSLLPPLAVGAVTGGGATGMAVTAITSAWAESQQQVEEALRNGATPEQVKEAARMASVGGLTEPLPIEMIFNRIPVPLWGKAIGIFGKLAKNAMAEGGQEVLQTFIQNFAEKYNYNPDQDLTEGMVEAGGIGAVLGAGAGAAVDAADAGAPGTTPPPGTPPPPGTVPPPAGVPPPPAAAAPLPPGATGPAPPGTPPPGTPPAGPAPLPVGAAPPAAPPVPMGDLPAPAPIEAGDEEALPPLPPDEPPPEAPAVPEEPLAAPAAPPEPLPAAAPLGPGPGAPAAAAPIEAPAAPLEVTPGPLDAAAAAPTKAADPYAHLKTPEGNTLFWKLRNAGASVEEASAQVLATLPAAAPTGPRSPAQVQRDTGVPYAAAARTAEAEGWTAPAPPAAEPAPTVSPEGPVAIPAAPEMPAAPAAAAPSIYDTTGEPIGTRRSPAAPQYAGDRVNLKASDAQKAARNSEIGHYRWQGQHVGIEIPAGGTRSAIDPARPKDQEPAWQAPLPQGVAYGRIRGTKDVTGSNIKAFVGPSPESGSVFVIDQIHPDTGAYQQPKAMLDFATLEDARAAYVSSYSDGRGAERIGSISQLPVTEFKAWAKSKRTVRPFDRKATADSRRLRQAYAAEAQQQAAAAAAPAPEAPSEGQVAQAAPSPTPDTGQPGIPQGPVAPEQGEVQVAGPQVQRQAPAEVGPWYDALPVEHRDAVLNAAGVMRSPKLSWQRLGKANQDKIQAFHRAVSPETAAAAKKLDFDTVSEPVEKGEAQAAAVPAEDRSRPVTQAELDELIRQHAPHMRGHVSNNDGGKRVFFRVKGKRRKDSSSSGMPNEYGDVIDTLQGFRRVAEEEAAGTQAAQPEETQDAQAVRSDTGQAEEGDAVRPSPIPRGGDIQQQAQGAPGDGQKRPGAAAQGQEKVAAPKKLVEDLAGVPVAKAAAPKAAPATAPAPTVAEAKTKGAKAQAYVVTEGKKHGVEFMLALDATGNPIEEQRGAKSQVGISAGLSMAIRNPKNSIVVHHNHPGSTAASSSDVAQLAHAGLYSVWAHGHDGTVSRVKATAATTGKLKALPADKRKGQLLRWINHADAKLATRMREAIAAGRITQAEGDKFYSHVLDIVLHDAGIIDYDSNIDGDAFIAKAELENFIEILAETTGMLANVEPRTTDRYNDRPALTLRHPAEVGTALGRTAVVAKQRGRQEPVHPAGPTGDRGNKAQPAARPAEVAQPLADRWDKLSFAAKEPLLDKARVSRSPVTSWKNLGPENQQKLQAAEAEQAAGPEVFEEADLGRRLLPPPDPGRVFDAPVETRIRRANRLFAYRAEGAAVTGQALKKAGHAVPNALDLAQAIDLHESSTGERGEQLESRRVDPIIKGLRQIGATFEEFSKYLYAAHAGEANTYLRSIGARSPDPSGMSDAEAAAILASANPRFAALAQHVYAMNKESLLRLKNAGNIDQATYDQLSNRYQYWVPLRGWEEGVGDEFAGTGRGFDVRGPEFRQRLGRYSKADDPLAYSIQAAHASMVRASKNRVAQVLHRLVKQYKNDAFWTVDKAKLEDYKYTDPNTGAIEVRQRWVPPPQLAHRDLTGTIVVRENGVPHYITIHDEPLLTALRTMGAEESNTLLRYMGQGMRILGKLYTTLSPNFVLRNALRDIQTAMINMQGDVDTQGMTTAVLKQMPSASKAMWGYIRGKPRPPGAATTMLQYAHDFAADGGKVSWIDTKSIEAQKRRLRRVINGGRAGQMARSLNKAVMGRIEAANGAAENAVRLALYTEMRKRGHPRAKAAAAAKDITVNFNRKGTLGQAINSIYLFFNARVQGNVKVLRTLHKSRRVRFAVGILGALGAVMDWVNRWAGGDDDEGLNRWDNVPQWEKERNFIVMLPPGHGMIKIPLSFGYNFFYVAGQQAAAATANLAGYGGTEPLSAAFNIAHSAINATSPLDVVRSGYAGLAPTAFQPFVEMWENKNYRDAPIYPTKYDPKDPDAELYFKSVSPFWKEVAADLNKYSKYDARKPAAIDISPESLEHLQGVFMGGAGQFWIEQMIGGAVKLGVAVRDRKAPDIEAREIPVVREFFGQTDTPYAKQNTYYKVWDDVDQLHRNMTEEGVTGKERRDMRRSYPVESGVFSTFESAEKQLRSQRQIRKKLEANDRLSGAQRQRRLDAVEKRMQDIRSRALKAYGRKQHHQQSLH